MSVFSNKKRSNDRYAEYISKFSYYISIINAESKKHQNNFSLTHHLEHSQLNLGPTTYHYFKQTRPTIKKGEFISISMLQLTAEKVFKNQNNYFSINPKSLNPEPFSTIKELQDIEVIVLKKQATNAPSKQSNSSPTFNTYSSFPTSTSLSPISELPLQYLIYVIHISKQTQKWTFFVERIALEKCSSNQNEMTVEYESILGFTKENKFMQLVIEQFSPSKSLAIIKDYLSKVQLNINSFQSGLSRQIRKASESINQKSETTHIQFKRQDKLPAQHVNVFRKVKVEIYQYFNHIHQSRKVNPYFIDNLICRFLNYRQYNYQQTLKSVKNYLDWEKKMRQMYTYESFNHYHKLNLYQYLGNDISGRPVLNFKCYNVFPYQIVNLDEYIDFTFYMLDIFIQDLVEGYIDEFILISNYQPFSTDNFSLKVARQVADRARDLFPERQYKLICFGVNSYCLFLFNVIKPFLPSFLLQKVMIFGVDRQELKQSLAEYLDLAILPREALQQGYEQRKQLDDTQLSKNAKRFGFKRR